MDHGSALSENNAKIAHRSTFDFWHSSHFTNYPLGDTFLGIVGLMISTDVSVKDHLSNHLDLNDQD